MYFSHAARSAAHALLVVIVLVGYGREALARQLNHRSENEWTSTQKASLGNIGALSENFADQFFADPSLQARKKNEFDLQIISLNVYFTDDTAQTQDDLQEFTGKLQSNDSSESGLSQGVETLEFVASLTGRRVEAGGSLQIIALRAGRFTILPYVNAFGKAHIDVPSWPEAEVLADQYAGIGLGYSQPVGAAFDLGINIRPGYRVYLKQAVSASSINIDTPSAGASANEADEQQEGFADGFKPRMGLYAPIDLAIGYNLSNALRFNLVARNSFGASIANVSGGGASAPPAYSLQLSGGAAWRVFENKTNRVRLATEIQDTLNIAGLDDLLLRWQWGFQYLYNLAFRSKTTLGLNAGLQSGYPAVGLLLDLFLFKIEAAWFTVEGGGSPGQDPIHAKSFRIFSEISF